jgi:hypothetical protein
MLTMRNRLARLYRDKKSELAECIEICEAVLKNAVR